jgi:hypothetical protein
MRKTAAPLGWVARHSPLVTGHSPFGMGWLGTAVVTCPTAAGRSMNCIGHVAHLRPACGLSRTCFGIEPVDQMNVAARDQMHILVRRYLDRAMTHLVPYKGEGSKPQPDCPLLRFALHPGFAGCGVAIPSFSPRVANSSHAQPVISSPGRIKHRARHSPRAHPSTVGASINSQRVVTGLTK